MKRNRILVKCKYCQKEFETIPYNIRIGKGKYCSQKCYWQSNIGKRSKYRELTCMECGKKFIRNNSYFSQRRNRGNKNFGRYCSKACLGLANGKRMKEKHWNWKGGITKRNLSDKKYTEWKIAVFERDGYKCTECKSTEKIEAHHVKTWKDFPNLHYKVSNGQTLCQSCHKEKHR